jgi:hypothetical protein
MKMSALWDNERCSLVGYRSFRGTYVTIIRVMNRNPDDEDGKHPSKVDLLLREYFARYPIRLESSCTRLREP